ncbi:MAG: T9SS type A sorting domain-containing protein [Chitinophagia bacterium]
MKIIRWTFVLFIFITGPIAAQLKASYLISSIGSKNTFVNNISSIQFKSIPNCIDVQTGINALQTNIGKDNFVINCSIDLNINTLGLKFYPNPVINNAKVKFIGTPPLKSIFNLYIYTTTGELILSRKESGYNIFQGILLNLSFLSQGAYFIQIESLYTLDIVKFIKS